MNKDLINWMIITSKLLMWGLSILAIYWIILKLTNHSPTIEEVILVIVSITITGLFALIAVMVSFIGEMKEFKGRM